MVRRGTEGQAAVETALTLPMFLFTFLGILQLSVAYQARILTEYAAFKAARAGSVYRADCERMKGAALMALLPAMSYGGKVGEGTLEKLFKSTAEFAKDNRTDKGTPIVWVNYELELGDQRMTSNEEQDFDQQLDSGDKKVMRIRVRLAHFFEYRIPFANWIMVRSWLATQRPFVWAEQNPTMLVKKADMPPVRGGVDTELVDQAMANLHQHAFTVPIVANWSMRMMSQPLDSALGKSGKWKCR